MIDPKKFFDDNLSRIRAETDPMAHNTNAGLLALVGMLQSELAAIRSENEAIRREIQEIRLRLR